MKLDIFQKNSVAGLQSKSEKIFNVFTQTVQDLTSVNNDVEQAMNQRQQEIERIQAEHNSLHSIKASNQKMIDKINTFING